MRIISIVRGFFLKVCRLPTFENMSMRLHTVSRISRFCSRRISAKSSLED